MGRVLTLDLPSSSEKIDYIIASVNAVYELTRSNILTVDKWCLAYVEAEPLEVIPSTFKLGLVPLYM